MLLRDRPVPRAGAAARLARVVLMAAAAWLAAAPPASGQAGGLEPPRLLNTDEIEERIAAGYPAAQRDSGSHGRVVLYLQVREDGTADSASVTVRTASNQAFVAPARAVVPRLRFSPAKVGGRPVAAWFAHTVTFSVRPPRLPGARVEPRGGTIELRSGVDDLPVYRDPAAMARLIQARYPRALRAGGASGTVMVRFRILENGSVEPGSPSVELTTDPRFDDAAVSVIGQARFRPAKVNGRPVKVWVTVPLRFEVQPPPPPEPSLAEPGVSAA
jgi:TonB family protein